MNINQTNGKEFDISPNILKKAVGGDDTAQLTLGKAYFNDVYTENNCPNAFEWFLRSAKQGNMEAQFRLGDLYALGHGIKQSHTDAFEWYTKAALQGYKKALIRIHNLYQEDVKMHCRGQLCSQEEEWDDDNFKKEHQIRELYEYRLEQLKSKLNYAIEYSIECYKKFISCPTSDMEITAKLAFLFQHGYGVKNSTLRAIELYTEAAKKGHRDAQYNLGYIYQENKGIKFHYKLAIRWYRASAINGNIAAQNCLAYFYEKGLGTELSLEGAIYWYIKAASFGSSNAQLTLGRLYRKGQGVNQCFSEAAKWYELAANQGNTAAKNCLNKLFKSGKIIDDLNLENISNYSTESLPTYTLCSKLQKDITKFDISSKAKQLKVLAMHALMSDGNAMYQIGLKYYNGDDLPQDKGTGFQWMKKAAKAEHKDAILKIAKMYKAANDDTVEQDYHESSIWTMKLVRKRNDIAQYNLGFLYKTGLGVRKDPLEASKWFIKSADQGNTNAKYQFGLLKFYGEGVRQDIDDAFKLFYGLALQGNPNAFYNLGVIYSSCNLETRTQNVTINFFGTSQSTKTKEDMAILMFEIAANLGHNQSRFKLGKIYEEGKMIKQDLTKSLHYHALAAASDYFDSQKWLAIQYLNGIFEDPGYTSAFDILQKMSEKLIKKDALMETIDLIFRDIYNKSDIIYMLILASERGVQGLEYYIAYFFKKMNISLMQKEERCIYWYTAAAKKGDSRAQCILGNIYREALDLFTAIDYYSEAYKKGDSEAAYRLGLIYLNGDSVSQDLLKAFRLFTEASAMGYEKAYQMLIPSHNRKNINMLEAVSSLGNLAIQYQVGVFYQNNSDQKCLHWLTLAAEGGVTDAYYRLGQIYEEGKCTPLNMEKSMSLYKMAIEKDHEDALFKLAQIYHYGKTGERNYLKAFEFYERAAKLGNIGSLSMLNVLKTSGELFDLSFDQINDSVKMAKFVAKQGNIGLQYELGNYYKNNKENKDYNEAFKWYKMASDNDHTKSIYQLALLYETGLGIQQDYRKSFELYTTAKSKGSMHAIYRMGVAYQYGYGTEKNFAKAFNNYAKAAELGNPEAQHKLGELYRSGVLVQKNIMNALIWYTIAYLNNHEESRENLYKMYIHKPYEIFFHKKLFQILSIFDKNENLNPTHGNDSYGPMHYKLGKMYIDGIHTNQNDVEALKQFRKAYNSYYYDNAKYYIVVEHGSFLVISKGDYIRMLNAYTTIQNDLSGYEQYKIGMIYYMGVIEYNTDQNSSNATITDVIIPKNYSLAVHFFGLASKNRCIEAQDQLDIMIYNKNLEKQLYQKVKKRFNQQISKMEAKQCYERAMRFYKGDGVDKNDELSLIYLQSASEKKNYLACIQLSEMYFHGNIVQKNEEKATQYIKQSTLSIDSQKCYSIGMKYYNDYSIFNHFEISLIYLRKAAEENHRGALNQLGLMYIQGEGVEKDKEKALWYIEESIHVMNIDKCYDEGMNYYNGYSVSKDLDIALIYLRKATIKNHGPAQTQLGKMYLQGEGVEKDKQKALKYIEESIRDMDPEECYDDGMKYYNGYDVAQDFEIALIYLRKAAEENNRKAQAQLGVMFLKGEGVEKDKQKALKYIEESIRDMDPEECYDDGMKCYNGYDFFQDFEISLIFFRKAAEENHSKAQAQLGVMYFQGKGVKEDKQKALKYIEESIRNMDPEVCYQQGMEYYNKYYDHKNFEIPLFYFQNAAKHNHGKSQAQLGIMCFKGEGLKKDNQKAKQYIQLSMQKMDPEECYLQGIEYYNYYYDDIEIKISLLYFEQAAKENHSKAQAQLGVMYLQGKGVKEDKQKALKYIEESIRNMDPEECYNEGLKYYDTRKFKFSLIYFRKAAKDNHREAQAQLGIMYLQGEGVEKDKQKALKYIEESIRDMDPEECYDDGMKYYNGYDVTQDFEISLIYLRKAAEENNRKAQAHLGIMYFHGEGVEKNKEKASIFIQQCIRDFNPKECYDNGMKFYDDREFEVSLIYFRKAAEKNHREAQAQLGIMYLQGEGVEKDKQKALKYIEESIRNMDPEECYNEGLKYYDTRKFKFSLIYFRKAAKDNHREAQAQLGIMYLQGEGVEKDKKKALEYIRQSAKSTNREECYIRGMKTYIAYYNESEFEVSLIYFRKAAEENHREAQAQLGIMYLQGEGVEKDKKKALKYIKQSAKSTNREECYIRGMKTYIAYYNESEFEVSLIYFRKAAEENHREAQAQLGIMYLQGEGVEKDKKKALKYIEESIRDMDPEECYDDGMKYYNGYDVAQDFEIALIYLRKAAEENNRKAQAQLGVMFLKGEGVEKDKLQAAQYIEQSVRNVDIRCRIRETDY